MPADALCWPSDSSHVRVAHQGKPNAACLILHQPHLTIGAAHSDDTWRTATIVIEGARVRASVRSLMRRMRRYPGVRASLLALILLWGLTALWHQYDLALHSGDQVCAACIVAHALDNMTVAAAAPITLMSLLVALLIPFTRIHLTGVTQSYEARGPPHFTSR